MRLAFWRTKSEAAKLNRTMTKMARLAEEADLYCMIAVMSRECPHLVCIGENNTDLLLEVIVRGLEHPKITLEEWEQAWEIGLQSAGYMKDRE